VTGGPFGRAASPLRPLARRTAAQSQATGIARGKSGRSVDGPCTRPLTTPIPPPDSRRTRGQPGRLVPEQPDDWTSPALPSAKDQMHDTADRFEHAREPARKTRAVDEAGLVGKEPHLELRRRGSLGEERLSGVGRPEEGDMRVILDARERAGSSGGERRRERATVGRDAPEATWSRARARSLTRWSGGSSRSASTVQRGSARRTHPGTVPLGRRTRPSTSDFFLPTKTVPFSTRHE
jgi:hypothetical protein